MTSKERKKLVERFYLDRFQTLSGWSHKFIDSERPDFLATTREGVLGVEVTQLFKDSGRTGSVLKEGEEHNARFLAKLAKAYYSQGGEPILVTALIPNTPNEDTIPYLVRRLKRHRSTTVMDQRRFEATVDNGPRVVMYVTSLPHKLAGYNRWQCATDSTGWVRIIDVDMLSARIAEKAINLIEYRKSADRVILLLVVDRTKNSGMLEPSDNLKQVASSGFDEVHLLIDPIQTIQIA